MWRNFRYLFPEIIGRIFMALLEIITRHTHVEVMNMMVLYPERKPFQIPRNMQHSATVNGSLFNGMLLRGLKIRYVDMMLHHQEKQKSKSAH